MKDKESFGGERQSSVRKHLARGERSGGEGVRQAERERLEVAVTS